jgi:hypothetical protein
MINIKHRGMTPPSLMSQPIKDYLDAIEACKNDPTLPKPECSPAYRNADIFEAFDTYFHSKCYLSEEWFLNSWAMDVEHFIPQAERPDLKYDWSNLYPASHDANMVKPSKTPEGGYLDPCKDDVEKEIRYAMNFGVQEIWFEASDPTNQKAVNTAQLLSKIHNGGNNANSRKKTETLKHAIWTRKIDILKTIDKWREAKMSNKIDEEFQNRKYLQALLSKKAAFTMLMRSMDAVKNLPSDFLD